MMFRVFHANYVLNCDCNTKKNVWKALSESSSESNIAILCKLQIEKLKFVYSSCCFIIPELALSDQLIPGTHNFRTNLFRPTKFRTNKFPDQLNFGFLTILTELSWSDDRCFTVFLCVSSVGKLIGFLKFSSVDCRWSLQPCPLTPAYEVSKSLRNNRFTTEV